MLVLTRKPGESIYINGGIIIKVLDVRPSRIRLGIDAPTSVRVQREERRCGSDGQVFAEILPFDSSTAVC
jgi:carbon storage regulator